MNFAFVLPKDAHGNTGIVVFVDRLIKMAHLAAMPDLIDVKVQRSYLLIECFANMACLWQ